jgi:hypothetical protein
MASWSRGNSIKDDKGETVNPVVIGKANYLEKKVSKSPSGQV